MTDIPGNYWWLLLADLLGLVGLGLGLLVGPWFGSQLAKIDFTSHLKALARRLTK